MGILNATPDSFSDGGLNAAPERAYAHAVQMIAEGANIIDVGGESTRPGADAVSVEQEQARVIPVLKRLCSLDTVISIDTYRADTARKACALGASLINDVWGLQKDPEMADVVAETGAGIVMMHNRQGEDRSIDILDDMLRFFERSIALAERAGIPKERQILDPGFGFGKVLEQNYMILNGFDRLLALGRPVLAGASRKRMIGEVLNVPVQERLAGSLAVHVMALQKGAKIVRVHDVKPHVDAAKIVQAYRKVEKEAAQ
ncbi:dihydropteroate synthase [Polycladidibacter hongkongensis]|uniref:dihydropteroate synthase n=1 Tax=Polycladidibacter hongkongensis TaxID=1647556 RepID=UPI00082FE1BC